jgi:hypothetical protein
MIRRPIAKLVLAGIAGSTVVALTMAPQTPWMAPDLQPLAAGTQRNAHA